MPNSRKPSGSARLFGAVRSLLDPRAILRIARLLRHHGYTHYRERAKIDMGSNVGFAPTGSITCGELTSIGEASQVKVRYHLWAGDTVARIAIGYRALFTPEVFMTTTNYQITNGIPVMDQPRDQADVRIGAMTWLGIRVAVPSGLTIGDGCAVAAGAVVTKDLPPNSIAAGVPAKVIGRRPDRAVDA